MKRKKVKEILKPDFREKFSEYLNKTGALLDEYNVPQELINKLAKLDMDIEEEIDADMVELTDETIADILKEDEDLTDGLLFYADRFIKTSHLDRLFTYLDAYQPQFKYIEVESLREEMIFDEFREKFADNPYQLKIA